MTAHDAPAPPSADAAERAPKRVLPGMALFAVLVSGGYAAFGGVLLSNQAADIDATHKVQIVTLVSSAAFVVAMVLQPVIGALSDRTRGRLGRRAPWLLAGGVLSLVALSIQGHLTSVPALFAGWMLVTVGLQTALAPQSAVLPDFYPPERRGRVSAVTGFAVMIGIALCTTVGGLLANDIPFAFTLGGVGVFVACALLALAVARREAGPRDPFSLRAILRGMWVNPRANPDFAWAFVARFLFVLGYFAIYTFQLYLLTDYLGFSRADANRGIGVLNLTLVVGAVIGVVAAGVLSDRIGRRKPFLYGASAAMAIGMLAALVSPTFVGLCVMAGFVGIGFGIYQSVDTALMSQVLPSAEAAGRDLGILNIANAVPQIAAPLLGGVLIQLTGGYASLFVAGIVVVALAGLALRGIRRVR